MKAVKIKGIVYKSGVEAAKILNISQGKISQYRKLNKYDNEGNLLIDVGMRRDILLKNKFKNIKIKGVVYKDAEEAASKTGIPCNKIIRLVRNKRFLENGDVDFSRKKRQLKRYRTKEKIFRWNEKKNKWTEVYYSLPNTGEGVNKDNDVNYFYTQNKKLKINIQNNEDNPKKILKKILNDFCEKFLDITPEFTSCDNRKGVFIMFKKEKNSFLNENKHGKMILHNPFNIEINFIENKKDPSSASMVHKFFNSLFEVECFNSKWFIETIDDPNTHFNKLKGFFTMNVCVSASKIM